MDLPARRVDQVPIDAFALLQRDHLRVLLLAHRIDGLTPGSGDAGALVLQLSRELAVHASIEETVLYAALGDGLETRADVLIARKRHERIHELLFDLAVMAHDDPAWRQRFGRLSATIAEYVQHEEAELFPRARQLIPATQLRQITRDLVYEQRRLGRVLGGR